ncbi:MAG TPA: uracil-DNA glycosylase [Pyrinomonadaceae bacterium]|nr:uracil-DNA glycosylase [Pyrinomonadaceae bacterium]
MIDNFDVLSSKAEFFKVIYTEAQACRVCPNLADKIAVLSELNGNIAPKVFFIGEAPGRVGADRTRRPFYGDKSGANLQLLLDSIDLSRDDIFITSAVMCSPRSATDANRRPTRSEIVNCSAFLKRLIELIDPPVVATLGSVALEALKTIAYHEFKLKTHAGTQLTWNGRLLIPLYHPSPQVIASTRRLHQQLEDFQMLDKAVSDRTGII